MYCRYMYTHRQTDTSTGRHTHRLAAAVEELRVGDEEGVGNVGAEAHWSSSPRSETLPREGGQGVAG